jgi:hypothetical protein
MQTALADSPDARLKELAAWLGGLPDLTGFTLEPASADASFRRYFRLRFAGGTRIAMDAPPALEDARRFVRVAELMRAAGLHVPSVFASDFEKGFLLLSDLGPQTYLDVLDADNADDLMRAAIDPLIRWQRASCEGILPDYDADLLLREVALFPDWYVARHLGVSLNDRQRAVWDEMTRRIVARNLAEARVFVHRDYMPRNLMRSDPNPGVLDFQDAVYGPISYDIASLTRDAFISWDEERVIDWAARYWQKAKAAALPVPADFGEFYANFEWMGLQRHLKVAGIFARIRYRDGKPRYLADTPRFIGYVRHTAGRYAALAPLLRLIDELEERHAAVIHSF